MMNAVAKVYRCDTITFYKSIQAKGAMQLVATL
jgi:hypothetical protein